MLPKITNPAIQAETQTLTICPEVQIYVKTLTGPQRSGRRLIYIHGGGGGGPIAFYRELARALQEEFSR
jgi:hypothetical protein